MHSCCYWLRVKYLTIQQQSSSSSSNRFNGHGPYYCSVSARTMSAFCFPSFLFFSRVSSGTVVVVLDLDRPEAPWPDTWHSELLVYDWIQKLSMSRVHVFCGSTVRKLVFTDILAGFTFNNEFPGRNAVFNKTIAGKRRALLLFST